MSRPPFHPAPIRKGVATLTVMLVLVVVALAMTTLARHVSDEARHSMDQSAAAQLEQMLMAGTYDAKLHLNSSAGMNASQSWATDLPSNLTELGGKLQITVITTDTEQTMFQVVAHLGKRSSSQSIHFQRRNGRWELVDAQLE